MLTVAWQRVLQGNGTSCSSDIRITCIVSDPATLLQGEKCKEEKKKNKCWFCEFKLCTFPPSTSPCREPGQHLALSAASEKRSAVDSGGVE